MTRWHFQRPRSPGTFEGFEKSLAIDIRNALASRDPEQMDDLARELRRLQRRARRQSLRARLLFARLWALEILGKD